MKAELFDELDNDDDNWSEAFSVCRERNCPIIAKVGNETAKIYPSGYVKTLTTTKA